MGLTALDEIDFEVERVDHDDYGDDYYKYKVTWYLKGKVIFEDYFHKKPNDTECYNTILSVWETL